MQTFFLLVLAAVACAAAWVAWSQASALAVAHRQLTSASATINAVHALVGQYGSRLQKLEGRVYALQRHYAQDQEQLELTAPARAQVPVCENWKLAQIDGPGSKAAECMCAFCENERAVRRTLRANLAPRGAHALARFTRENA